MGKKRGASETWGGGVIPDGRKETETFARGL